MEYRYRAGLFERVVKQLTDPYFVRVIVPLVLTLVTPAIVMKLARKMSEYKPLHVRGVNIMAFTMCVLITIYAPEFLNAISNQIPSKYIFAIYHFSQQSAFIAMLASTLSLSKDEIRSRLTSAPNHPPPGAQQDSKKSK